MVPVIPVPRLATRCGGDYDAHDSGPSLKISGDRGRIFEANRMDLIVTHPTVNAGPAEAPS
jgi:hypothetical protein